MYLLCEKLGSKYKPTLLDLILLLQMNWNCDFREKLGGSRTGQRGRSFIGVEGRDEGGYLGI